MTRTLGGYVQRKRDELGWNQTELAERSGVPRTTVNRIETGTTKFPAANVRRQLARALGVSHLDLLVAAGELTEDEITTAGKAGVVPVDPVREALLEKLRRIPLDDPRIANGLDGMLSLFFDPTRGDLVEHGGHVGDAGGIR